MTDEALFGAPGAPGGLYDPPPVGSDDQAKQYIKLDFAGHATVLLPYMMDQGHGSIMCVASDAAKLATPGEVVIGAAMAGIVMFCRGLANEAKRSGIRVNAIAPGYIDTEMVRLHRLQ